ncbi:hypothetical protein RRG08_000714 [Elysia crispata]|uniref:Uncharacterized protein n=1 Tax=Elysia crispata TaxID=231223 RepID=A0AAE1E768_9GAST|nr:hypothetical protein RRG08_000714 [Elysia crispata]
MEDQGRIDKEDNNGNATDMEGRGTHCPQFRGSMYPDNGREFSWFGLISLTASSEDCDHLKLCERCGSLSWAQASSWRGFLMGRAAACMVPGR